MPSCYTAEEDDGDYLLIHGLFYDFEQGPDVGVHGLVLLQLCGECVYFVVFRVCVRSEFFCMVNRRGFVCECRYHLSDLFYLTIYYIPFSAGGACYLTVFQQQVVARCKLHFSVISMSCYARNLLTGCKISSSPQAPPSAPPPKTRTLSSRVPSPYQTLLRPS